MAKKRVKVELNEAGIIALLRSAEVQECVNGYADRAVERLGEGYEATHTVGPKRAKAKVTAVWYQTRSKQMKDNVIMKALK